MDDERLDFLDVARILLENALDEAVQGHCTAIAVEVSDDAIQVTDDGRGLPVHQHPVSRRPLLEVILMGPRRGPRNSLARVNACCLWIEAEIHRDGGLWRQRFEFALPAAPVELRGAATRRGTKLTCAPLAGSAPSFEELCELVRQCTRRAGLRVKVRIFDRRVARDETIVVA